MSAPQITYEQGKQPIGGWLIFFCISVAVGTLKDLNYLNLETASIGTKITAGLVAAFIVWVLLAVTEKKPYVFKLLTAFFLISFLSGLWDVIGGDASGVVPMGQAVIWFFYFMFSKRVKRTYGRNLGDAQ